MELLDREGLEFLWSKIKQNIENKINNIGSDVTNNYATKVELLAVQNTVNSLTTAIEGNAANIQDLQKTIDTMRDSIAALDKSIANINVQISEIQKSIQSLDDKYLRKDKDDTTSYTLTAKSLYKS